MSKNKKDNIIGISIIVYLLSVVFSMGVYEQEHTIVNYLGYYQSNTSKLTVRIKLIDDSFYDTNEKDLYSELVNPILFWLNPFTITNKQTHKYKDVYSCVRSRYIDNYRSQIKQMSDPIKRNKKQEKLKKAQQKKLETARLKQIHDNWRCE